MNERVKGNACQAKKVPPKKPPRLTIGRKPGSLQTEENEKKPGNVSKVVVGENKESVEKNVGVEGLEASQEFFENRIYQVIDPLPADGRISDLDEDVIETEARPTKEHIYESISDEVRTRSTSSQTEGFPGLRENVLEPGEFIKVFKDTSSQTEGAGLSPELECRRNNKRNSDSREEEMPALAKSKECRLSSDSSTSTQDSADSGHFSGRNPERSPLSLEHSESNVSPYPWQPEGLNKDQVKSFMNSLHQDKVPTSLSPQGVTQFNSQLAYQNPKHDADPLLCKYLTKDQAVALKCLWMTVMEARGTGFIQISDSNTNSCVGCGNMFKKNDMVVSAHGGLRHPSCFSCSVCQQFLTKLIYYSDDNNRLFCGRHYAELFKPRCYACDELIISGKFVRAMNHTWHAEHFCCGKCGEKITEEKYTTEEDKAICLKCHTTHLADDCQACGKKIKIGQKRMTHGKKHWHDECFICDKCESNLVLGSFSVGDEKLVCSKCYRQKRSKMCCTCGEEIKHGSHLIEQDGLFYHSDCFCCKYCHQPIRSNFMEHEGSFYCPACHRSLFSEKCEQCGLAVMGDGVTYNNQIWHNSCFGCHNCKQPLSTRQFIVRYGNRYCNGCYERIFAKQCHSCSKLIKDSAYLTTNDLHWHTDCFKCTDCHKDLGDIGFHMIDKKTYCSDCPSRVY